VLYAPPGIFIGPEALDKFAGDFRATHPNFVCTPHGQAQILHNAGRLAWGSGPRGEPPNYTGLDVVIVRDGKIAAVCAWPVCGCCLRSREASPVVTAALGQIEALPSPRLSARCKIRKETSR
jgi:hypothetical protein